MPFVKKTCYLIILKVFFIIMTCQRTYSLDGVGRTGMFLEGYEIDHLHSKLSPMHGTGSGSDFHHIEPKLGTFIEKYQGYLSSHDCERADDSELAAIAQLFRAHA